MSILRISECTFGRTQRSVAVWGQSHAGNLFERFVSTKDTLYCFKIPKPVTSEENKAVSHFCHLGWPAAGAEGESARVIEDSRSPPASVAICHVDFDKVLRATCSSSTLHFHYQTRNRSWRACTWCHSTGVFCWVFRLHDSCRSCVKIHS